MSRDGLIVLKLGGSVLRSQASLAGAVEEVARHLKQWDRAIVVPSAFSGVTDALAESASKSGRDARATAALLATGELESAARLALALDAHGIETSTVHPASIGLYASGPALDASPESVQEDAVDYLLARSRVLVVPGFVAVDDAGRTCCLGRGGSDLTALFLAHALGAGACRLVKDVDGLYESDPNVKHSKKPRRFASLDWDGALALDGSIVQHKGVRFAQGVLLSFEVGAVGSDNPTRVGAYVTVLEEACEARGDSG